MLLSPWCDLFSALTNTKRLNLRVFKRVVETSLTLNEGWRFPTRELVQTGDECLISGYDRDRRPGAKSDPPPA